MSAPRRAPSRAAPAVLALLAAAALPVAAELALRRWSPLARGWFVWPPGLTQVFEPAPGVLPGVSGPARFGASSLGLRADELPSDADCRVLALGGSTTECLYLDQSEAWPRLLQDLLAAGGPCARPWVGNAGRSGHTAREHVFQLEHLLARVPGVDVAIVLAGVNDLCARLGLGEAFEPRAMETEPGRERARLRAFRLRPLAVERDLPWPKRLALWRLASHLRRRLAPPARLPERDGSTVARWRAHRAAASELRDALPDLGPALAAYRRDLEELARIARRHGVELVLATQPCLWRADLAPPERALLWMGGVGAYQDEPGAPYYSAAALAEGMARYDAVVREVARAEGLGLLDLAALVPRTTEMLYDDVHFTEAGARRVAELAAEWLAAHPEALER